jgi:hypothetical protein
LFPPIVTETAEYIKTNWVANLILKLDSANRRLDRVVPALMLAEPGLAAPIIFLLAWSMRLLGDRGNSPG